MKSNTVLLLLKTPDIYVNVKLMYNPKDYVGVAF